MEFFYHYLHSSHRIPRFAFIPSSVITLLAILEFYESDYLENIDFSQFNSGVDQEHHICMDPRLCPPTFWNPPPFSSRSSGWATGPPGLWSMTSLWAFSFCLLKDWSLNFSNFFQMSGDVWRQTSFIFDFSSKLLESTENFWYAVRLSTDHVTFFVVVRGHGWRLWNVITGQPCSLAHHSVYEKLFWPTLHDYPLSILDGSA